MINSKCFPATRCGTRWWNEDLPGLESHYGASEKGKEKEATINDAEMIKTTFPLAVGYGSLKKKEYHSRETHTDSPARRQECVHHWSDWRGMLLIPALQVN